MRTARFVLASLFLLAITLTAWPQKVSDAPARATIDGTKVTLPTAKSSFTIPEKWLTWREFFKLDATQLAVLATPATGEWDRTYGPVTDAVLPLADCLCHLGDDGWEKQAYSFADIQMRAYLTDVKPDALAKALAKKGSDAATASKATKIKVDSATDGPWSISHIAFDVFYIDYGGTGNVYFYSRPAGDKTLVMVFMMVDRPEGIAARDAILKSFEMAPPTTQTKPK